MWFSYRPLCEFRRHATEAEARAAAEGALDDERHFAEFFGWGGFTDVICYGPILAQAKRVSDSHGPDRYELRPVAHNPAETEMPRNMSFSMTWPRILAGTKTVTRRSGWGDLEPGELFRAVKQGMGLPRGAKVERGPLCRCLSNTPEQVCDLIRRKNARDEVAREGFPQMTPAQFVAFFVQKMRCQPVTWVNRIAFEYVDESHLANQGETGERKPPRRRPTTKR